MPVRERLSPPASPAHATPAPASPAAAPASAHDVGHRFVQMAPPSPSEVHALARRGTAGTGSALPHAAAIQRSFGRHSVAGVRAFTGAAATKAAVSMGARAFATGNRVAFAGTPSLHTAAHEAAHTVQQSRGVRLAGGVGAAGDAYERHADAVADAVVAGRSAEALLDAGAGAPGGSSGGVQRKIGFEFEIAALLSADAVPNSKKTKKELNKELINVAHDEEPFDGSGFTDETDASDIQPRKYLDDGDLVTPKGGRDPSSISSKAKALVNGPPAEQKGFNSEYVFHALSKKDPIVTGEGFTLEADEGNADADGNGRSVSEFVTDAFEEDGGGRGQLDAALTGIDTIGARVRALAGKERGYAHARELHGGGVAGRVVFPTRQLSGVLQVTGAVDLARVSALMTAMAKAEGEAPVSDAKRTGRYMLGNAIGGAMAPSPVGNAAANARTAIAHYANDNDVPNGFGSKKLEGLVGLMAAYMMSASSDQLGYAKTIAPLMARTDFAAMFGMLDDAEFDYLEMRPGALESLVHMASGNLAMNVDLFPHGLYNDPRASGGGDKDALKGLTRSRWVRGVAGGTDYLTKAHFNRNPDIEGAEGKKDDLESMGALGNKTENVGLGAATAAPIFEIRSLGQMSFEQMHQRALDIFDFIVALNLNENAEYVHNG